MWSFLKVLFKAIFLFCHVHILLVPLSFLFCFMLTLLPYIFVIETYQFYMSLCSCLSQQSIRNRSFQNFVILLWKGSGFFIEYILDRWNFLRVFYVFSYVYSFGCFLDWLFWCLFFCLFFWLFVRFTFWCLFLYLFFWLFVRFTFLMSFLIFILLIVC